MSKQKQQFSWLEHEIMLQVNESLYQKGVLTKELYEQAKVQIVHQHGHLPEENS